MKRCTNAILKLVLIFVFIAGNTKPELALSQSASPDAPVDLPGWPMPDKPIPHHKPGQPSKAESYTTLKKVEGTNAPAGLEEVNGLEAMLADGNDPLSGNYMLVGKDQLLRSSSITGANNFGLETFEISPTITLETGSLAYFGNYASNDIAAGDLNYDGQAEQIVAYIEAGAATSGPVKFAISELPGTIGRVTSAPAAAAGFGNSVDLLVRGPDHALWYCNYAMATSTCTWKDDGGGGVLLSPPVIVPYGESDFDVYAILASNLMYRRAYVAGNWSGGWQMVDDQAYWQPLASRVPVPEFATPAVVEHSGQIEMFRIGPDNTLRWRHSSDGMSWDAWQNLGGSLASGLAAVTLDNGSVQVYARGVDDRLWYRTYSSSWGGWQRVELTGMGLNVDVASAPAAVSLGGGQVDVYVRGSDDALWVAHYNGSIWGSWSSLGGTLNSAPTAVQVTETILFAQTGAGGMQVYQATPGWEDISSGIPIRMNVMNTGLTGYKRAWGTYHDFSVDVETGYFWGDGRRQIVLGYYSADTAIKIGLYDISDNPDARGFTPELIASVPVNGDGAGVGNFRIATGDFLGLEGLDEIAVVYTVGNNASSTADELKYRVDIYRFNRSQINPSLELVDYAEVGGSGNNAYWFSGTLVPASADLDGDKQDELAVITNWITYNADSYGNCDSHSYWFMQDVFDINGTSTYDLKRFYVDGWVSPETDKDAGGFPVALTLTAGDVIGDGREEIIRTWPESFIMKDWMGEGCLFPDLANKLGQSKEFKRYAQTLTFPVNANPNQNTWPNTNGVLDTSQISYVTVRGTEGPTEYSYGDRLAAGDFDRDLRKEVFYQQAKTSADLWLITYQLSANGTSFVQSHYVDDGWHGGSRLAVADFSGESIRVGLPTYRKQYDVGKVIAIVNAPPKHKDTVNGVVYDVNASQSGTYAVYEQTQGTSTEVSVNTHVDWGVDAEFKYTVGDPEGSHVTGSITASYGQDFNNATGSTQTTTFAQKVSAVTDDVVYYVRVNYEVWEYPVYDSLTNSPQGYMSVVWPSGIDNTMESANTCNGWYRPSHQLMNIWSYPSKPEEMRDRDTTDVLPAPSGDGVPDRDLHSVPNYEVGVSPTEFSVEFSTVTVDKRSFKYSIGVTASIEAQKGGDEVDAQVTKTRTPALYFKAKGTFNYSDLSEWTTTTTNSTKLSGFFEPIANVIPAHPSGNDYRYFVDTYLYRSKSDVLVMNYLTEPSNQWFWSSTSQIYNKPDPAFILPWADGQCDHIWPDAHSFSSDIVIDPPMAQAGDVVTITATLHNFSYLGNGSLPYNKVFNIAFYHGDPDAGGVKIGEKAINVGQLGPRGVLSKSIQWTADGSGEQHIYAKIDPTNNLEEVHDEGDLFVNNNKAYGVLSLDAVQFIDVGQADEQPYYPVNLTQGVAEPSFALHVPLGELKDNMRFDMLTSDQFPDVNSLGAPFDIQAYRTNWDTPEAGFSFRPLAGDPPAVVLVNYENADLQGFNENELKLFRFNGIDWELANASCGAGYDQYRVASEGQSILAVPICQTGTFFLGDHAPVVDFKKVFLPLVRR